MTYKARHESHINMVLYSGHEHMWDKGVLLQLWQWMQEEPAARYVWGQGEAISPNEFIRFFGPRENRVLFFPVYSDSPETAEIMGGCWLDDIAGHRSTAHFFFRRRFWGEGRPLIALRRGLELIFQPPFSQSLVLGRTVARNALSVRTWRALGMAEIGCVPDWFHYADGSSHAALFSYLTKEMFEARWPALPPPWMPRANEQNAHNGAKENRRWLESEKRL